MSATIAKLKDDNQVASNDQQDDSTPPSEVCGIVPKLVQEMDYTIDENLTKKLKKDFPGHQVFTIRERGWNGLKNGILLQKLLENNYRLVLANKVTLSLL